MNESVSVAFSMSTRMSIPSVNRSVSHGHQEPGSPILVVVRVGQSEKGIKM